MGKFDYSNIEDKNLMVKTPFSSFFEGDSIIRRNAIDSFVSNNMYEFDKLNDDDCNKSIEVQDMIKFDECNSPSTKQPIEPSLSANK